MELLPEDAVRPEGRLDAHGRRQVRRVQQQPEVFERQDEHRQHPVGAVYEGEPLLLPHHERLEAPTRERFRRRDRLPVLQRPALAAEAQDYVGERCQVAARGARPSPPSRAPPPPRRHSPTWASGARSPLAPSEPCSGTAGTTPAFSMAARASTSSTRTPERPAARGLARPALHPPP